MSTTVFGLIKDAIVDITAATIDQEGVLYSVSGTGFFIDSVHVVTAARVVTTTVNRVPAASYYIVPVQRIIGVVYNNGEALTITLKLIGLSPVNDVAVLQAVNPPAHSSLSWGVARNTPVGTEVYTIGDLLNRDARALSGGILRDNRMTFTANPMTAELIDTNISLGGGITGAPIVTSNGQVIGIVTFTLDWLQSSGQLLATGSTVGTSQEIAQRVVGDIIAGKNTITVQDPVGNWLQYIPSALGASYTFVKPIDLLPKTSSGAPDLTASPLIDKVEGVFVVSMDPGSPLASYLNNGDMITHVNGQYIGYQQIEQVSMGTALAHVPVGTPVVVYARSAASNYQSSFDFQVVTIPMSNTRDTIYSDVQVLSVNSNAS
jgi:S1-C subfamily serine protease